jgi:arylsulfatase A-like enzyme
MPFSHVHTTAGNQPQKQYSSCRFQNTSIRGAFGDALAEVDWMVGSVVKKLDETSLSENTLILFTGDNGPWLMQGLSSGSAGIMVGRYSGYWNTGKGSTWEGGIHEAAFAHWKGQITPGSRSAEVVSSLDLFPTVSALAGVPLPSDRVYDGRDMSDVLLKDGGKSKHEVLFFYGGHVSSRPAKHEVSAGRKGPSAARMGCWKAHWGTGPGMGPCAIGAGEQKAACPRVFYPADAPLLFNVCIDPSEGIPLAGANNGTLDDGGVYPKFNGSDPGPSPIPVEMADILAAQSKLAAAYKNELATFTWGKLVPPPLLPGETGTVRICCDKDPFKPAPASFTCDCDGPPYSGPTNAVAPCTL